MRHQKANAKMSSKNFDSVECFTLRNKNGVEVEVLNYGGYVRVFRVPDKNGVVRDIVLGYDSLKG